jgi:hypothetical protein
VQRYVGVVERASLFVSFISSYHGNTPFRQVFTAIKPGASADSATAPTSNDISTILAQRRARKTQPTAPQSTNGATPANTAPQSTSNAPAANINSNDASATNTLGDAPNVNGSTTTNTRNASTPRPRLHVLTQRQHPQAQMVSTTQAQASTMAVSQGAQNLSNLAATNGFTTTNTPNASGAQDPSAPAPQRNGPSSHLVGIAKTAGSSSTPRVVSIGGHCAFLLYARRVTLASKTLYQN